MAVGRIGLKGWIPVFFLNRPTQTSIRLQKCPIDVIAKVLQNYSHNSSDYTHDEAYTGGSRFAHFKLFLYLYLNWLQFSNVNLGHCTYPTNPNPPDRNPAECRPCNWKCVVRQSTVDLVSRLVSFRLPDPQCETASDNFRPVNGYYFNGPIHKN